jgi:hypothetical protein
MPTIFRCLLTCAWLSLPGWLPACTKTAGEKAEAQRSMAAFYDCVNRRDMAAALAFYAPEFLERNGREKWAAQLAAARVKLGALIHADLKRASAETQLGRSGGTFLLVVYRNQYEHGSAEETLRLKQLDPAGGFKIFSHEIRSDALRKP